MRVFNLMYFTDGLLKTHLHSKTKMQKAPKIRIQEHRYHQNMTKIFQTLSSYKKNILLHYSTKYPQNKILDPVAKLPVTPVAEILLVSYYHFCILLYFSGGFFHIRNHNKFTATFVSYLNLVGPHNTPRKSYTSGFLVGNINPSKTDLLSPMNF